MLSTTLVMTFYHTYLDAIEYLFCNAPSRRNEFLHFLSSSAANDGVCVARPHSPPHHSAVHSRYRRDSKFGLSSPLAVSEG